MNINARVAIIIAGIPTPSPTPRAIFSLLLRCGLSTTLTSCGFEGVDDGAAVEAKSFFVEADVLVTGLVLVIILVTGVMLEEARVLVIIFVEGEMFEGVIGAVKAIKSGLETTILDPVSRQFALAVSQTSPGKAEPQLVLVHIATAFKKVTLEHRQAFDAARVVIVGSGQPDAAASANKHG